MKKVFAIFLSCLVLALFVVPSFASPNYPFDYLNRNTSYYCFTSNTVPSNNTLTPTDYQNYITNDYSESLVIGFLCLDSSFNLIPYPQLTVIKYVGTTYVSQSTYTRYTWLSDSELYNSSNNYYTLRFQAPYPNTQDIQYICLIPILAQESEIIESDYFSFYYFFRGYQNGTQDITEDYYLETLQRGYDEGYSDGFSDGDIHGYNRGVTDDVSQDIKGTIFSTVSAPFQAITNFLNFEVLNVNLAALFAFIVTAVILVFIIKQFVK